MTEDSQQISVAELLKRNGQSVESRGGRRRRGVAGGISVAELTGEIPIVRQSGSRAAAEPESAEPAASEPATAAPETAAPSAPAEAVAETAKPTAPAPKVPADRTAAFAVSFDDDDDDEPQAPKAESKPVVDRPVTTPKPTSTPSPGQTSKSSPGQTSKSSPGQWVSRAPLNSSSPTQVTQEPALLSGQTLAGDLMRQERAATQSPSLRPPILPPRVPTPVAQTPAPAPAAPDDSTELIDKIADADSSEAESTAVVDLVKAPAVADSSKKSTAVAGPETDVEAEPAREEAGERNSIREWAVLAGQVVVALIVGGAMFKGFEKLWDMLPWVALVLALIVIVGLVAVVRVLRKTDDITSFVIAVVVGMIVTLGPLAFLLTSG
ncbi:hypothetical protein QM716_15385 [Rhodococcus sp. IEGM 1409]|uniref:hypothetical protein n=1 Tax=Rhodococcus sp. IEGM 1409 TaxID=3047082 RepID=UPI0024B7C4E2|nr:hypothetical protein [Rhodococcus sp. IEGM 1409]MDI9901240.1 hypothetical protein [Rhodococcus sp. IEGM 1409]